MSAPTLHASCVVVGEAGVLIRGPSGAGKSALAVAVIARAQAEGLFGRLVADDRVAVEAVNGRLVARAPHNLRGLIERRGVGMVEASYIEEAVLRLVVDLTAEPDRMPSEEALTAVIEGVQLPRITGRPHDAGLAELVLWGVRTRFSRRACDAIALAFAPQHETVGTSAPHARPIPTDRAEAARGGPDSERNEFCAES